MCIFLYMKITKEIKTAIEAAIDNAGSQSKFAELSGVPRSNLSKYLGGQIKVIREDCWMKLFDHLTPFLPRGWEQSFTENGKRRTFRVISHPGDLEKELGPGGPDGFIVSSLHSSIDKIGADGLLIPVLQAWERLSTTDKGRILNLIIEITGA